MDTVSVTSSDYDFAMLAGQTTAASSSDTMSDAEELYANWIAILCTQLENQDPTDPVDTTEYTSQLIDIASLEQQALSNETLNSLLTAVEDLVGSSDSLVGYIGNIITAYGDTAPLSDGTADWEYELDESAESVSLSVLDEDGNVVYSTAGKTDTGNHSFTWHGTTDDGGTAEDGSYQLVVDAADADGNQIDSTIYASGTVTGVDTSGNSPTLLTGNIEVPSSYVISIIAANN